MIQAHSSRERREAGTSRQKARLGFLIALTFGALASVVQAATLRVPSEYATIQAAIDASESGDVVLIAPGIYTGVGNRDLDPGTREITILGEAGPAETVLDCEGAGRALWVHGGQSEAFQFVGLTVRNGYGAVGAAILVDVGSQVTVADCVIEDCHVVQGDDRTICSGQGSMSRTRITRCGPGRALEWRMGIIDECEIVENEGTGVFVAHGYPGSLLITRTVVTGNGGSGLWLQGQELDVEVVGCVLSYNGQGYLLEPGRSLVVRETTFASYGPIFTSIYPPLFDRCILNNQECGLEYVFYDGAVFRCCSIDPSALLFGSYQIEDGYTDDDPMYCEPVDDCWPPVERDYWLHEDSPCTAENSPCGERIGAYGVGCGVSDVWTPLPERQPGLSLTGAVPAREELRFRLGPAVLGAMEGEPKGLTEGGWNGWAHASAEGNGNGWESSQTLGLTSEVLAEIVTLGGRRQASRTFVVDPSSPEIVWRPNAEGASLRSGVYFLRVTGPGGMIAAEKFVWLR